MATAAFLDQKGAFDNIHVPKLMRNLQLRGVPARMVDWIASFLNTRYTLIGISGFQDKPRQIRRGLPQGSPLLPILYLFYNADLLEQEYEDTLVVKYIDDVAIVTRGATALESRTMLQNRLSNAQLWAAESGAVFDHKKTQYVLFNQYPPRDNDSPITFANVEVHPASSAKYLGVYMDSRLKWRQHGELAVKRSLRALGAISALTKSTYGMSLRHFRQLVHAVVFPVSDYAAAVWHRPGVDTRIAHQLELVTRRACRMTLGAFRSTPAEALHFEANIASALDRLD